MVWEKRPVVWKGLSETEEEQKEEQEGDLREEEEEERWRVVG